MDHSEVKSASTVVIFNKSKAWPSSVMLLKRSEKAAFLPGAYVFPGGQLEPADRDRALSLACQRELIERLQKYFVKEPALIAAHLAAAVRETYEEAGLKITPKDLWPLSWWVTPPGESRRFDTWFFLAGIEIKEDAPKNAPSLEVTKPLWLSPKEALISYENGVIFLAPPTRSILERMAETESREEFLSLVDQPLRPIHPHFIHREGQKFLILPGHEEHPQKEPSRFIMRTYYSFP